MVQKWRCLELHLDRFWAQTTFLFDLVGSWRCARRCFHRWGIVMLRSTLSGHIEYQKKLACGCCDQLNYHRQVGKRMTTTCLGREMVFREPPCKIGHLWAARKEVAGVDWESQCRWGLGSDFNHRWMGWVAVVIWRVGKCKKAKNKLDRPRTARSNAITGSNGRWCRTIIRCRGGGAQCSRAKMEGVYPWDLGCGL